MERMIANDTNILFAIFGIIRVIRYKKGES
jgi:hypothetical protein